ncbi:MAG: DUF2231 domain-containing protein [Bacteroidota bacterium]
MPLHPFVVHFPIVLMIVAGVLYFLSILQKGEKSTQWRLLGFYAHAAGVGMLLLAIVTGDLAETEIVHTPEIAKMAKTHEMLGMISAWGFGLMGVWAYLRQKSNIYWESVVYVILFWGIIGVMGYSAHMGGRMVYEEGAGVAPMKPHLEMLKQK